MKRKKEDNSISLQPYFNCVNVLNVYKDAAFHISLFAIVKV